MSQQLEGTNITFEADGATAMPIYSRVTVTNGVLALAGVGVRGIGILQEAVFANSLTQRVAVRLFNSPGTFKMIVASSCVVDALLYAAASGKADDVASLVLIGKALEAASGNNSVIEVLPIAEGASPVSGIASGYKVARGQHTTVAAADTVVTGLTTVVAVIVSLETDPADAAFLASAQIGDQAGTPAAGSIIIKTWKSADGADVTPTAATAFTKKVNWVAIGT